MSNKPQDATASCISKRRGTLAVKTRLQNQLIWMICAAMLIPTVLLGGSLFLMVTRMSSPGTVASPHEVFGDIISFVAVLYPLLSAGLLYWVFHGTNKLVGPIERISRELQQRVAGSSNEPITLRPGDQLMPLVDTINALLKERERQSKP